MYLRQIDIEKRYTMKKKNALGCICTLRIEPMFTLCFVFVGGWRMLTVSTTEKSVHTLLSLLHTNSSSNT